MTKNTLIATLLAATIIFSGTAAYAHHEDNNSQSGQRYEKQSKKGGFNKGKRQLPQFIIDAADTDSDGKVSKDEMKAYKDAQFAIYDVDGDGKLSQEELTAMGDAKKAAMQTERFAKLDTDSDGQISPEELAAGSKGGPRGGGHKGQSNN